LYSDNGVTPLANPFLSTSTGQVSFYAADGRYDIVCAKSGYTTTTIADMLLEDPPQLFASNNHIISWGNLYGNVWDGVSDYQAYFGQTQASYLSNGSLGAVYAQRIASYSGGSATDLLATVCGASRGYNQIATTVNRSVECGGLFVADNYSYLSQAVGVYGQGNSRKAGRAWGAVIETHEYPETYTATAGQTVFVVPNGFAAIGAVSKNGTLLTVGTQYTASTPNVTLTSGASAGDTIKIYRKDPAYAVIGAEIDCFAGLGTDTSNPISGNRIGTAIFGYRQDKSLNVSANIGTLLALIADPSDTTYLTVDRMLQPQGKFQILLDFTASNLTVTSHLLKTNSAGSGLTSANHLALGNGGSSELSGYASLYLRHSTNGGLAQLTDGTVTARILANSANAVQIGAESNHDALLIRNNTEVMRLTANTGAQGVGLKLAFAAASTTYANDAAAATGGVPVGGIYRNGSALQVRIS